MVPQILHKSSLKVPLLRSTSKAGEPLQYLDTLGYPWIRLDTLGHAWIRLDTLGNTLAAGDLWEPFSYSLLLPATPYYSLLLYSPLLLITVSRFFGIFGRL